MSPAFSAFCRSCGQMLCLLLALAVGMQGLPVHTIVKSLQGTDEHHACAHAKGYCPMNPDGPCRCDRNSTETPDRPTFQSCGDTPATVVLAPLADKWRFPSAELLPVPQTRSRPYSLMSARLTSQRTGDDVFHPPRVQAHDRPGSTLQALPSA
jgi:hypothetical protein